MKHEKPTVINRSPDIAFFTPADEVVLEELYKDINGCKSTETYAISLNSHRASLNRLSTLNNPNSEHFQPTVFSSWDHNLKISAKARGLQSAITCQYVTWARTVVRHETDVVFLTHIILYLSTTLPSAIYLYCNFHYIHAIAHCLLSIWFSSSFTLLLHNHIHNNGVLSKRYALVDLIFPYILEPLMGHTWDSYYYHHIKHHHVEGNGPDDLSSTLRYQRDSIIDFLKYEARFLAFCWAELPLYFVKKRRYALAFKAFVSEISSYMAIYSMARWKFPPTLFVLVLPFCVLRFGLMIGNWGQHALIDEVEPTSDLRSSITLIDVPVR